MPKKRKSQRIKSFVSGYGSCPLPDNSTTVVNIQSGGNDKAPCTITHRFVCNFELDGISTGDPYPSATMLITPMQLLHSCKCHKLAALCFFEWGPDEKWEQVPIIPDMPNTTFLCIGLVDWLQSDIGAFVQAEDDLKVSDKPEADSDK